MSAETITRDEILAIIRRNMATVVEGAADADIPETASMKDDFGADSLEIVEVVSRSMKELRIKVPRTELSQAGSIKELVDIFERYTAV